MASEFKSWAAADSAKSPRRQSVLSAKKEHLRANVVYILVWWEREREKGGGVRAALGKKGQRSRHYVQCYV